MNMNWKDSFDIDDLAVLHEAGHASVAIALRFPTVKVKLERRSKYGKLLDPGTTEKTFCLYNYGWISQC